MKNGPQNAQSLIQKSPSLLEALQVAYYHCVLQMPLKNIAVLLGKSPATITRRLEEVRQAGWLHDRPEFRPPPELWAELQSRMTCNRAEERLMTELRGYGIQHITVLPSAPEAASVTPENRLTETVERIGRFAAGRLCELLGDGSHIVGVNWGWSVRQCIANLRPNRPNPELRFVPLVGNLSLDETDPHFEEAIECSSNRLAQAAATAFNSPRAPRLSTPAYIPRRFDSDPIALRAVRDFIESDVSYRRIFGENSGSVRTPGLIDQVDTVITGLTSLDVEALPTYRPSLITEDDLPLLRQAGVEGDLALHLVTASGTRDELDGNRERALVHNINQLIVGASPADLQRIAGRKRNGESHGMGVVVLASGPWKARILAIAIRMGAVNELVTDLETATALARELGISSTEME